MGMVDPSLTPEYELAQVRAMIDKARHTLREVRRGKLPANEARIIHDLFGPAIEIYRCYSLLPDDQPWQREAYAQVVQDMEAVRAAAGKLRDG